MNDTKISLSYPSPLSSPKLKINTNGHCFLCLKDEESNGISFSQLVSSNPKEILSFQPLIRYLTGAPHNQKDNYKVLVGNNGNPGSATSNQNLLELIGENLPPLCLSCYNNLSEIYDLHQQLLQTQIQIQGKTEKVREFVLNTIRPPAPEVVDENCRNPRDKFLRSLGSSGMDTDEISATSNLILKTHERIISEGPTTPVLFPVSISTEDDIPNKAFSSTSSFGTGTNKRKRLSSGDSQNSAGTTPLALAILKNMDTSTPLGQLAVPTEGVNVYCSIIEDQIAGYDKEISAKDAKSKMDAASQQQNQEHSQVPTEEDDNAHFKVPLPASDCISLRVPPVAGPSDSSPKSPRASKVVPHIGVSPHIVESGIRLQLCDVCNERIPRGDDGASHLATHIGSDYVSYCKECEYSFISPFRLNKFHESRLFLPCKLNPTPIFQCDLCPSEADNMESLRKHLAKHQTDLQITHAFNCPLCPLTFKSKKMVELHLGDNHVFLAKMSGRQNCDICKSYFSFEEIEGHLFTHGVKQPLRCKMCASMFSNLDALIWHQSLAKQNWLHEKVCHLCENLTTFPNISGLRSHYFEAHGLGSKFICEICYDEFLTREDWEQHQLRYHEGKDKNGKWECKVATVSGEDSGVDTSTPPKHNNV